MKYYTVGKIINTHGIKGEVKINNDSDFDRFNVGNKLYIERNKQLIEVTVASHRIHKGFDLVSFVSYQDINLVLDFKGCTVKIDENQHDDLEDDEFYFDELIGKKVYNQSNVFVGIVVEVRDLPQGELLEIQREGKKNALVPFVNEFIISVDDEIIINEIEGLL